MIAVTYICIVPEVLSADVPPGQPRRASSIAAGILGGEVSVEAKGFDYAWQARLYLIVKGR